MSDVHFDLSHSSNLGAMAPPVFAGGGFGNAAIPVGMVGASTYIIVNTHSNNRYIGISGNIAQRFQKYRLPTITEMGFGTVYMAGIGVTWGDTTCRDTGAGAVWRPVGPEWAQIDGRSVDLEHLLIRFVINKWGIGGTVSNNLKTSDFRNPTNHPINVRLSWGVMRGLFPAGASPVFTLALGALW